MQRITGTKLVILDQKFWDCQRYVRVTDLIQWVEEGIEATKRKKKPHGKHYRTALNAVVLHMKAMEYGYEGGSTTVNIPNKSLEKA